MYKLILTQALSLTLLLSGCNASHNVASLSNKLETIPLELTTHLGDQQKFVEGDEIQFLLNLGSDAYIYMYYIDANNQITQLLPNENQASNFYTAGYFLTLPEYENNYRFTISKPFGNETVWVIASDQKIETGVTKGSADNSIEAYKKDIRQASKEFYGEYELKIVTTKQ